MSAPLEGVRVVDLTEGIAGAYATKLLADGGAEVVKVERPGGDWLRGWSASGATIAAGDDGALFQFLASSKTSVVVSLPGDADLLDSLLSSADIVVVGPGGAHDPHALRRDHPHAVVVSITPWGLDSPWADRPATDAVLQALAGAPMTRGSRARPPVAQGGQLVEWTSGMIAAIGALTARWRALSTGDGDLVDVSQLEAAILTTTMYSVTWASIAGTPMRPNRSRNLPAIHRTKDGYVGFMVVTGQQWLDFCALAEQPDWMDDESLIRFHVRASRSAELTAAIDAWAARHTTEEILDLADALRVPASPVGRGDTVVGFDHFVERHGFLANPRRGFTQPDVSYTLSAGAARRPFTQAPRLGEHNDRYRSAKPRLPEVSAVPRGQAAGRLPFEGLRVLDFTMNWAGPIVGNVLAMFGADVIHVESIQRPDALRFNTLRQIGEPGWWEWAPQYIGPNAGKRDLTVNMGSERGRELALRLVAHADVVIENYSPRVMDGWGMTYDKLRGVKDDIIYVRAPAYGLTGPWRDRGGYAQTMEMASGLAWMTGWPDEPPEIPNGPMDPTAGGHTLLALLLALEHRRRTGLGMHLESSMIFSALNIAAEQVIEYSAYGALLSREGNRSPYAAPQGAYRTSDRLPTGDLDRWMMISVATDGQWEALKGALGCPTWADDPALDTREGRRAAHDLLDNHLATWAAARTSDEAVATLAVAGVPAAPVLLQHEPARLEPLLARKFYESVERPITGGHLLQAYPARLASGPAMYNRTSAPLLGQHNTEILRDLLGLTDEQIKTLEADGVIGTEPDAGGRNRGMQ
ncbi:CoA transferase [Pseudofrankia sp. BMG5.37]|uniref:CaiB/BaiF CoA transferase family protein n=1 Tax=Pseudofrankia sp. BMG5.37 TaxID=3050035 RepID=UPI0028952638|nr:CoA transferase [Pseudofrankia sp. BMG5.37]MDT3441898.1 CoA transferase [Pseudofrankia sp. BMG5.37]